MTHPAPSVGSVARALASGGGRPGRVGRWVDRVPAVRSAVAVVLRPGPAGAEVLLLRRAERPGDPWSGHVSLPGGRAHAADLDLCATAARECREEAGVDPLAAGTNLGRLPALLTRAHRQRRLMTVTPWVFEAPGDAEAATNHEAVAAFWVPLSWLRDRSNREAMTWYAVRRGALRVPLRVPCYRWDGHVIWGLTLVVLDRVVRLAR